jgi:hypothetical protein
MSDLVKAQNTPQFNWYTCWTSLGADGMPDKLIEEGLKQPDQIKVSFKKGAKEISSHVASNQARFGAEYFLAFALPDFKSKILTRLSDAQKDNGPLLFSLLGWSVLSGRRPDRVDRHHCETMPEQCRLDEGTLRPVHQGLPQGRCWVPQHRRPADSLASYGQKARSYANAWVHAASSAASQLPREWLPPFWTMDIPTAQEKSEQIFFTQPKAHQNKFANLNKTVPADPLRMIAFFEQCQATDKVAGVLDKIAKDKKQPKEKKMAHLPTTHSRESSYRQHCSRNYRNYHQSDRRNHNDHQSGYCHW